MRDETTCARSLALRHSECAARRGHRRRLGYSALLPVAPAGRSAPRHRQSESPAAVAGHAVFSVEPGDGFSAAAEDLAAPLHRRVGPDGDAGAGDQELCEQECGDAAVDLVLPDPAGFRGDGRAGVVAHAARAEDAGGMLSAGGQPGGRSTLRRRVAVAGSPCQQGDAGPGCGSTDLGSRVAGAVVR